MINRLWSLRTSRFIVIGLLCLWLSACKDSPLYSALTEVQANEVEAALLAAGIDARKTREGKEDVWTISIPREQVPAAMEILKAQGLPREKPLNLKDVFPKEGLVSTPMEEKARYIYALSQELSNTLEMIDGVVSARVHIALPQQKLLETRTEPASASVVIIQAAGYDLSTHETDIKAIITDGIEDMNDVNRVTVKFFTKAPVRHATEIPDPQPQMATMAPLTGAAMLITGLIGVFSGWLLRKSSTHQRPDTGTSR